MMLHCTAQTMALYGPVWGWFWSASEC